ncbi:MAG: carboxypeptidase-like regulatory domain-containing protein, partial [Bacteroidia bacterium]|nr:carboxypeptidase-like regulatory domain-containing protein [Bacteroidia bacterium]
MKKLIFFLFLCLVGLTSAQEKFTLSGYVKDAKNGESLIGASVVKAGTTTGAVANEYGFYSLTLPKGTHTIVVSYIGYENFSFI